MTNDLTYCEEQNKYIDNPFLSLDTSLKRQKVFNALINFINNDGFPTDFTHTRYGNIHWQVIEHYFKKYPEDFNIHKFMVAIANAKNRFREKSLELMQTPRAKAVFPIWSKFADKFMSVNFHATKKDSDKLTTTIQAFTMALSKASNKKLPQEAQTLNKHQSLLQVDHVLEAINKVF